MRKNLVLIVAALGILDSLYLTIVHYMPGALACPTGALIDCQSVLGSQYSAVAGVPIAIGGLIWFVGLAFMVRSGWRGLKQNIWTIFGLAGVGYSLTATALLGRICIYCFALDILILAEVFLLSARRGGGR